ncbi:hypothetical protein BaRGS_00016296 [Batillaria attramentaria]|uniref:Uncharacterized protein n=1 Tax=Batillaria attramentaria TaxID=370345 RepID=A0ABD0KZQ6_9CAEN
MDNWTTFHEHHAPTSWPDKQHLRTPCKASFSTYTLPDIVDGRKRLAFLGRAIQRKGVFLSDRPTVCKADFKLTCILNDSFADDTSRKAGLMGGLRCDLALGAMLNVAAIAHCDRSNFADGVALERLATRLESGVDQSTDL